MVILEVVVGAAEVKEVWGGGRARRVWRGSGLFDVLREVVRLVGDESGGGRKRSCRKGELRWKCFCRRSVGLGEDATDPSMEPNASEYSVRGDRRPRCAGVGLETSINWLPRFDNGEGWSRSVEIRKRAEPDPASTSSMG